MTEKIRLQKNDRDGLRVALVGLPGAGKSSLGRLLARELDVSIADSDAVIERQLNESIRSFFLREGEASFRSIEAQCIVQLSADLSVRLLATGGGVVLAEANRKVLSDAFTVVYLHASPDELHRRLRRDSRRPLLQVEDLYDKLHEMYQERDPLYREIANFVVESGRPTAQSLVRTVLMQLELSGYIDITRLRSKRANAPPGRRSLPDG